MSRRNFQSKPEVKEEIMCRIVTDREVAVRADPDDRAECAHVRASWYRQAMGSNREIVCLGMPVYLHVGP
ncbi:hypothetical protein HBH56_165670 [Parastagonospora nodorum]|nr:hypothetical protein HBH56_165670 [Parastagonospora nodorum]KAH3936605.1 hypothetical protein HBH54_028760 [Parastagonospora nodorum]KAH3948364.1 hypothetical protein HBH53_103530 [Parastagonospora nodorum]KAH3968794.1 hypothetical protein HBH51_127430 [Parastagonospora nodorum]KAH3989605.1 hypothetical protein HBH52_014490 [Parastagonospora nodorum]